MADLTNAQRQAYIEKVAAIALEKAPKYGYHLVSVVIAQCCKEPGFGTSELAINANNILGIKLKNKADGTPRTPIAVGGYNKISHEYVNGVNILDSSTFAVFASIEDCIEGYFQFLTSSSVYAGSESATDVDTYLKCIKSYATAESNPNGKTYTQSLKEDYIIPYGLTKYDAMLNNETKPEERKIKIMLDAGHDGKRNQSPVYPVYYESDFTWKLQTYLAMELQAYGFTVGTTRMSQSQTMDVVPRGKAAKGYDLFLSLHSDACGTPSVDRVSCIYLVNHGTCEAARESKEIAERLAPVITKTTGVKDAPKCYSKIDGSDRNGNGTTTDDDYYGVLYGSHQVDVPGIILEHSFHTNARSATWLANEENVKNLAKAEAQTIAAYFGKSTVEIKPQTPQIIDTVVYTVVKGDTLGAIAKKFNTTPEEIQALNPCIYNINKIVVGWKLTMPTSYDKGSIVVTESTMDYIVKKGDTLSKIGQTFGVPYLTIALQNGIVNPNKIYPGQVLKIARAK